MTVSKISVHPPLASLPTLETDWDTLSVVDAPALPIDAVNLTSRSNQRLTAIGITQRGTRRNDILRGTDGDDQFRGEQGNDRLFGTGGNDQLFGNAGNDRLNGADQDDRIFGGTGNDSLGGGKGKDDLFGGAGKDALRGNNGEDLLEGGIGDDRLNGGNGDDTLRGGANRDVLVGEGGNDILTGGPSKDTMSGGNGRDRFVYNSLDERGDTITDFDRKEDVIDLSRIIRGSNYSASDRFERYIIAVRDEAEQTIIRVDADGDSGDQPFKTLVTLEDVKFSRIESNNFIFG